MALKHAPQAMVRQYDYDDKTVIVADFGPGTEPSVDVLSDVAVVTVGAEEHDITLPDGHVEAFNHNGIVTIEVSG